MCIRIGTKIKNPACENHNIFFRGHLAIKLSEYAKVATQTPRIDTVNMAGSF